MSARTPLIRKPDKLREISDGYRVACEALTIAADYDCADDLYEALVVLAIAEADKAEAARK